MTELVTLASTLGRPSATSVGKRISDPPPAIELMAPARNATAAEMSRPTADTLVEITADGCRRPAGIVPARGQGSLGPVVSGVPGAADLRRRQQVEQRH